MDARPILVMGICGTGKSTVARALADRLGGRFLDADAFHDPAHVARMRAGLPLDDAMRWDWLDRVGAAVAAAATPATPAPTRVVLACSALGRAHRDRLRARTGPLAVAFLHGPPDLIAARMAARPDHYMPVSLIGSQLAALEPPDPAEEGAVWCDVARPLAETIDRILAALAVPHVEPTGGTDP